MLIQSSDLAELELFISTHQLDKESVCLVGSASLAYLGIRKNMDIDIIIRSDFRTEKFNSNETINISKKIDLVHSPWSEIYDDDEIIDNPLLHKKIEGGFKVVVPELLYHKKCWLNRLKDQHDIEQLSEYAQISKDWNWQLIENYLPKRRFPERLLAFLIVRLKSFRDNIYERFFKKNRVRILKIEATNFLLSKQYRDGKFNRLDIIVR